MRGAAAGLAPLLLAAAAAAQETRPARPRRPEPPRFAFESVTHDLLYSRVEGNEVVYVLRNPELRAGELLVSARRGVLYLDAEEYARAAAAAQDPGDPLRPGPDLPNYAERDLLASARRRASEALPAASGAVLDLRDAPFRAALRALYFDGDVQLRSGSRSSVSAEAVLVDPAAGRLLLVNGALRFDFEGSNRAASLLARARIVRQEADGVARLEGADITTCEFAVPHYHVSSGEVELRSVSRAEMLVGATSNEAAFAGVGGVPIPDVSVYSTDLKFFPVEAIAVGASNRDGAFLRTRFGHDFQDLGNQVNEALGVEGNFKGHWSYTADILSKRGFYTGGAVEYETPGAYRGKTQGYVLNDHGQNIGFLSDVYSEDKSLRGTLWSINRIYTAGPRSWLDFEVSVDSDPLFRPEFDPSNFKTEKYHENVLYFRTAGDVFSFSALGKTEVNAFQPIVETGVDSGGLPPETTLTAPFLDGRFHPAPIASLPIPAGVAGDPAGRDIDLVYSGRADGGYLERHFSDANYAAGFPPPLDPNDQRALVGDTAHELSLPFSLGLGKVIPYFEARGTADSASVPPSGAATTLGQSNDNVAQFVGTAGARLGTHLEGDGGRLRHAIDANVDYRNQFAATEDPDRFIPFFGIPEPGRLEILSLDLRNRFSWLDAETRERLTFADLRLTAPLFPDANRDNNGETFGPLLADFRFDFGPRFAIPDFRVRFRAQSDVEPFHLEKSDTSVIVSPFGPEIDVSLSYRESGSSYDAVAIGASWRAGRKWEVDLLAQYDFTLDKAITQRVSVRRYSHDWALELAFSYDASDNSSAISIAIQPLLGGSDRPRDRFVVPSPTFRGFY